MNLEDKIINKIKENKITPKPFWYFLVKDYSLWGLVFLSIVLAAISIAPIIFILENLELGLSKHIAQNFYSFIFFNIPFFWITLCGITTYFAYLSWEQTKHGYRFDGKKVLFISFIISLILGLLLNFWNIGRMIDNGMRDASMGNYKSFEERRRNNWFNPEEGRILGSIENISTSSFVLLNEDKNFSKEIYFDENIPGQENILEGKDVRVVGFSDESDNDKFIACAIFPDNLPSPNRPQKNIREKFKDLRGRPAFHEECSKIFERGRANFSK